MRFNCLDDNEVWMRLGLNQTCLLVVFFQLKCLHKSSVKSCDSHVLYGLCRLIIKNFNNRLMSTQNRTIKHVKFSYIIFFFFKYLMIIDKFIDKFSGKMLHHKN